MKPKILLVGGGSGGHVMPLIAVAQELKILDKFELIYIGERGSKYKKTIDESGAFSKSYYISSGKFRRYHGYKFYQVKLREHLKNLRDLFKFAFGVLESNLLIAKLKPVVMFSKGGFVALPIGLVAGLRKVPIVTHDSDAVAGMTNRLLKKYAVRQLKGFGELSDSDVVGVPVNDKFTTLTVMQVRKDLGLNPQDRVLLITGGGNASNLVNEAAATSVIELFKRYPDLLVMHHAGEKFSSGVHETYRGRLSESQLQRVNVVSFIEKMPEWLLVSEVIVARAGMTTLSEIAAIGRPVIIIPNPKLAEGHQLKNAADFEEKGAALVVQESELTDNTLKLTDTLDGLLSDATRRQGLSDNIHSLAKLDSAKNIANIIESIIPDTLTVEPGHKEKVS
jgi:UDP-N-acetylglucosamine--N-acetylmuramyl-(pentapeptide) pyrophosphoryl-undecaprenol N-acetylglucosamine transferase